MTERAMKDTLRNAAINAILENEAGYHATPRMLAKAIEIVDAMTQKQAALDLARRIIRRDFAEEDAAAEILKLVEKQCRNP